ncbi:hypothetical protein FRC04_003258 [Tulasnella sp. 424]|nr:hypothetical protein FRC04_003258 [Tulasnella sp. 424]
MQKDRTTSSAILRQDVSFTENHNYTRGKRQFGIRLLQNWTAAGLFDQFLCLIFVWDLYQENMGMRRQICLFCAADSRASSACAVYAHICSPHLALQTTSQLQDEIDHFHASSSIYAWWAWLRSISSPKNTEMADEIAVPNQPPLFIVTTVLAVVVYGYLILQNPKFRITGNALFIYAISLLLSFSSMPLHHTFKAAAVIPLRPIIMIEAILPEQAEVPSYIHFLSRITIIFYAVYLGRIEEIQEE